MKHFYYIATASLLTSTLLHAHPTGHDQDAPATLKHFLLEPDHLLTLCALGSLAAIAIITTRVRAKKNKQ